MTKDLSQEAYDRGYGDYFKGKSYDDNPYAGTNQDWDWEDGFNDAKKATTGRVF